MITIRCSGELSFGGRTQDDFVIYNYGNLEDFKKNINQNEFVKCKEIKRKYKVYIVVEEELVDRVVNFSNYMKISEIDIDLVSKQEYEEIINNLCKYCVRHDGTVSEIWNCGYYPTKEKYCCNFKETFTSKFRRRFKGVSVNERIE